MSGGGLDDGCCVVVFALRVKAVDLPEHDFAFAGGFGDDEVVVEFDAVDVVGVDCCGGDVWVGIAFRKVGCGRDGSGGGRVAGSCLVEDWKDPETNCVVHSP